MSDDDSFVAAARAGDETAFTALVERQRRQLLVRCYRMPGSLEEPEDLVQETFLRAWNNLPRFEGRSTLRAWLYRIAPNACLDVLHGRARRVPTHQLAAPSPPDVPLPPRPTWRGCSRFPTGWPARQIADLLDGSVASVNSAAQRARASRNRRCCAANGRDLARGPLTPSYQPGGAGKPPTRSS